MRLQWDETGKRLYETGIEKGVLYPINAQGEYKPGVAWNGLTSVSESPSGAEATALYADDIKYLNLYSAEEFGATIEAYTYPDEFAECDGSKELAAGVVVGQQARKTFGLAYKTLVGNDVDGQDHGYKLHLIYGAMCSPSQKQYQTVNDSPSAITFSWEVKTTPVTVPNMKPTASITIDSTKVDAAKLTVLENKLYGTDAGTSYEAVTPVGSEDPSSEGWYEKVGDNYVLSTDTTVDSSKTYYKQVTVTAEDPYLPLPSEVASIFAQG